jgi:RNA polymerase sigma-B factor
VHVARGAKERGQAIAEATDRLTDLHGRAPTTQQLAEYLELSIEDVVDGLQARMAHDAQSLDAPAASAEDDAGSLIDTLGAEDDGYTLVEDRVVVAPLLPSLSERERQILHMRFVEEMTQHEIAARIGVSQMQVSRLLRRSLERLRELAG